MVDTRSEGRDVLKLKRCAEELLRGVKKRTRPNDVIQVELVPKPPTEPAACDQQSTPQVFPVVSPFSPKREPQEVINHVVKEVRKWISGMPQLFWVAVSLPHMMARIYWCAIMVLTEFAGKGVGHAKPSPLEGVRRVVSWLKPLLRGFPPEQIQDFLIKKRLALVFDAYFGIQLWASVQYPPVFFSSDFGEPAAFDPATHRNAADQGVLRAGDECLVIFPAMGRFKPLKAISKPCVLPLPTPNSSLKDLLRASDRAKEREADYAWLMATLETQQKNQENKDLDVESVGEEDSSVLLPHSSSPD